MKKQIEKLFELAPIFREELTRHVAPNCHHRECPEQPEIEIYFSNGYTTFMFRDVEEDIEVNDYLDRINIRKGVTEKQMDDFIALVEQAILDLRDKKQTSNEVEIAKKREDLLRQLADLDK